MDLDRLGGALGGGLASGNNLPGASTTLVVDGALFLHGGVGGACTTPKLRQGSSDDDDPPCGTLVAEGFGSGSLSALSLLN